MMPGRRKSGSDYRVGIYAGSFDPVHAGHVAFALQAMEQANLDEVIFLPERRPRFKDGPEHFGHRIAMLKHATKPYRNIHVMEMVDKHFTVNRTLPQLQAVFGQAQLVFLVGSDVAEHMPDWVGFDRLMAISEIVVGVRQQRTTEVVQELIQHWPVQPRAMHVLRSHAAHISSSSIRAGMRGGTVPHGILESVRRYARRNWLYVSFR
jgi:nicotinate-nucleotide adenylyltransferase